MDLEWDHDKSRAYNRLQRIGIPTGKPRPKGHRHTQSLGQLSNLSPIPSLSSIATATSGASTTLNTPTSTSSFPVFHPKVLEELEDHTPTPTPTPKPRFRVPSSTPITSSAPSFSKGKPLGRSDSLKSVTSLSSAGSSLIRKLSLKSAASRSEASKTPPPRAQLVKPQTTHTMPSPHGHRASSFDSERIGVVGKSGVTHIQAHVDRDAISAHNHASHSPSKRAPLDQKSSTLTHSTSATSTPTTKRRQHANTYSESMPSTPLRKHSYSSTLTQSSSASKPSSSRNQAHTPTQKRTQPQPQGSAPQRPPSRSEHLLRSTLLKDDLAQSSANVTSANARPTTPTSSSSSSTHTHRRRHSHSSQTSSQTSISRREARDSDLIASSFLFRTNLSSTSPTSQSIVSPTPRRSSTTTNTRAMGTKPLFGFMGDTSDAEDESSSQGSGSAPGYGSGYGPTRGQGQGSRHGQYPGHTNSQSGLNTYTQQHHRNQHQSMHSPWEQHQDTLTRSHPHSHGRSQSFTHVDTARNQTHSAPRPPLTPHEQVLRARLERVLSAGTVGGAHASSKGKGREVDWDGEEEKFEDYIEDGRRKRSSLPVTARDQECEREGISGLFGSIGWLWRGGQDQEQESPGSSSSEGNPQLPTPSTPGDGEEYIRTLSPNRTYSPHAHTHSPGRIRSHTAPTPSSPSASRFHIQNPALVHAHASPSTRTQQSQSHTPSSSPIAAAAYLSPNDTNTTTPRGTSKRHVFSLEPVPSVGELRELAEEHEAAAASSAGKSASVSNQGSDKGGEMITPPPTPPRREKEFVLDGREDSEETPRKALSSQTQIKANAVNANALSQRRGSSSSVLVASAKIGTVALGRSKSARTVSTTIPNSKAGRTSLGLGRPTGLSRNGSTESRDDNCVLPSTPRRMASPTKASFSSPTAPTFAVDTVSSAHVAPKDLALSLSPTASVTSPASILSGTSTSSFNARTASMQCRDMEGYVSFASIEGLGEPPASANPSIGDGHSMFGNDEEEGKGKEGGGKRFLGWILGK